MKQNRIHIFQEFFVTQINFLLLYPCALTIITMFGNLAPTERPSFLIWLLGGLISFGMYLVRQRARHFLSLILFHIMGAGAYLLLSFFLISGNSRLNQVFFMLVGLGFLIYSVYLRLMTENFKDSVVSMPFAVGFVAAAIFAQHYLGNKEWDSYYKMPLILIIAYYLLYFYLEEYSDFLVVNASSAGILPEQEIFYSGIRQTFLYVLFGTIILICTAQLSWLQQILTIWKQIIFAVLRFLFSLFPQKEVGEQIITKTEQVPGEGINLPKPEEPVLFWQILEVLAVIALSAGIILMAVCALKRFLSFVAERMQRRETGLENVTVSKTVDVREKCEIKKKRPKKISLLHLADSREKIRQIYKKRASRFCSEEFSPERLNFYTARELEQYRNGGEFAAIYEKARYSNEPCTSQDVELMEKNCR